MDQRYKSIFENWRTFKDCTQRDSDPNSVANASKQMGFTLVETMVVLAVLAILAMIAAPSLISMIDSRRAISASEAILDDLRWARGESIKRNVNVRISYTTGSNWSYTVTADPAGGNTTIKTVSSAAFPNTSLTTNFTSHVVTFDQVRGTANNGTISLTSTTHSASIILSILGRARICGIGGYDACS